MHVPTSTIQTVKVGTKLDGFDRHCPQITSLAEIFCADHPEIMGHCRSRSFWRCKSHFAKLLSCPPQHSKRYISGNIENSAGNEHILTQEQVLDPAKTEQKFDARNKPLPKRISPKKEREFIKCLEKTNFTDYKKKKFTYLQDQVNL